MPLDEETVIESVQKTNNLVVVDEDYESFGMTGEVITRVVEHDIESLNSVKRLAVSDVPIPYARPLENEVIPGTNDIANAARDLEQ